MTPFPEKAIIVGRFILIKQRETQKMSNHDGTWKYPSPPEKFVSFQICLKSLLNVFSPRPAEPKKATFGRKKAATKEKCNFEILVKDVQVRKKFKFLIEPF